MSQSLIKKVKYALMKEAVGQEPPADFVAQDDMMDMILQDYMSPAPKAPKQISQNALIGAVAMVHGQARELSIDEIDAVIARVKNDHAPQAKLPGSKKPKPPGLG